MKNIQLVRGMAVLFERLPLTCGNLQYLETKQFLYKQEPVQE